VTQPRITYLADNGYPLFRPQRVRQLYPRLDPCYWAHWYLHARVWSSMLTSCGFYSGEFVGIVAAV